MEQTGHRQPAKEAISKEEERDTSERNMIRADRREQRREWRERDRQVRNQNKGSLLRR